MKAYIHSILVCAFCCGILASFSSNPRRRKLLQLVSGTTLAVCVLQPLSPIELPLLSEAIPTFPSSADYYLAEGKKIALEAKKMSIEQICESYILEKAKALGAEIEVRFSFTEDLVPNFVEINGFGETDIKMQLQNILATELGIPKENQKWIWQKERNSS